MSAAVPAPVPVQCDVFLRRCQRTKRRCTDRANSRAAPLMVELAMMSAREVAIEGIAQDGVG